MERILKRISRDRVILPVKMSANLGPVGSHVSVYTNSRMEDKLLLYSQTDVLLDKVPSTCSKLSTIRIDKDGNLELSASVLDKIARSASHIGADAFRAFFDSFRGRVVISVC